MWGHPGQREHPDSVTEPAGCGYSWAQRRQPRPSSELNPRNSQSSPGGGGQPGAGRGPGKWPQPQFSPMVGQQWARAGVLGRSMWGYTSFTQETSVEGLWCPGPMPGEVEPTGTCNGGAGLTSCPGRGADNRQGSPAIQSISDAGQPFPGYQISSFLVP